MFLPFCQWSGSITADLSLSCSVALGWLLSLYSWRNVTECRRCIGKIRDSINCCSCQFKVSPVDFKVMAMRRVDK